MLGYTAPNNDVYIFFESDELAKLRRDKVCGRYVNIHEPRVLGELEAIIDDMSDLTLMEKAGTDVKKDDDGMVTSMSVVIRSGVYEDVLKKSHVCLHQGYRQLNLLDANHLDFHSSINYDLLKTYLK